MSRSPAPGRSAKRSRRCDVAHLVEVRRRRAPLGGFGDRRHAARLFGGCKTVGLQQPEPDLADRRERRHRVPQRVERHFAGDRDRGRVQHLAMPGPVNVAPTITRGAARRRPAGWCPDPLAVHGRARDVAGAVGARPAPRYLRSHTSYEADVQLTRAPSRFRTWSRFGSSRFR